LFVITAETDSSNRPQDPRGGLVDKPGKSRDFYHTCYTLSGLSVAQNFHGEKVKNQDKQFVLGNASNLLVNFLNLFFGEFCSSPRDVAPYICSGCRD
jgi:prenyltransferase beta subunit